MSSYTLSESQTFTLTHAKHLASKVATDLKRIQRFYGSPSDTTIANYEMELIEILKGGYLKNVTYGFQLNEKWIEPTVSYTAKDLSGLSSADDDPGRIKPNASISGASFTSFLSYNQKWDSLGASEKDAFKKTLPFQRGYGSEPGINGYLSNDKTYSSGGRALDRSTVKSY
jgi:hypothetical protein